MPISLNCPSCGAKFRVLNEHGGRIAACEKCNTRVRIPEAVPREPARCSVSPAIQATERMESAFRQGDAAHTSDDVTLPVPPASLRSAMPSSPPESLSSPLANPHARTMSPSVTRDVGHSLRTDGTHPLEPRQVTEPLDGSVGQSSGTVPPAPPESLRSRNTLTPLPLKRVKSDTPRYWWKSKELEVIACSIIGTGILIAAVLALVAPEKGWFRVPRIIGVLLWFGVLSSLRWAFGSLQDESYRTLPHPYRSIPALTLIVWGIGAAVSTVLFVQWLMRIS